MSCSCIALIVAVVCANFYINTSFELGRTPLACSSSYISQLWLCISCTIVLGDIYLCVALLLGVVVRCRCSVPPHCTPRSLQWLSLLFLLVVICGRNKSDNHRRERGVHCGGTEHLHRTTTPNRRAPPRDISPNRIMQGMHNQSCEM